MEGSSLFATTPDSSALNPVGPLTLRNPFLIYKTPDLFSDFSNGSPNPIRLPPRLLVSPSRNYLCLFWHGESMYEILHIPSLLKYQKDSGQYPPPVEFGFEVVAFAWVNDNDTYAILHSSSPSDAHAQGSSVSGTSTKQSFSLTREIKSKSLRKIYQGGVGRAILYLPRMYPMTTRKGI